MFKYNEVNEQAKQLDIKPEDLKKALDLMLNMLETMKKQGVDSKAQAVVIINQSIVEGAIMAQRLDNDKFEALGKLALSLTYIDHKIEKEQKEKKTTKKGH